MKNTILISLILCVGFAFSMDEPKNTTALANTQVVHVATALDHLTVIEFGEPVTMAAAGSSSFQIERHDNKVFIKPLKAGAATDLFVWTATRRYAYELEPAGEVKSMLFALDSPVPPTTSVVPQPNSDDQTTLDKIADMMLTHAFLDAEPIDSKDIRPAKNKVTVRIEHMYRSLNTIYIHYSITNNTKRDYSLTQPTVAHLQPLNETFLENIRHKQLADDVTQTLGQVKATAVPVAHAETRTSLLHSNQTTGGIVAIRAQFPSPAVLLLTFPVDNQSPIQAIGVF